MFKVEKFKIEKGGEFYFNIKGMNGEIVASSEGYKQAISRDNIADRLNLLVNIEEVDYVKGGKVFTMIIADGVIDQLIDFVDVINVSECEEGFRYTLKSNLVTKENVDYNCGLPCKQNRLPVFFERSIGTDFITIDFWAFAKYDNITCITAEIFEAIKLDKRPSFAILHGRYKNYISGTDNE